MNGGGKQQIVLPGETDLPAFRAQARRLLLAAVAPSDVEWQVAGAEAPDLFGAAAADDTAADRAAPSSAIASDAGIRVPPAFLTLCKTAVLHSDPGRFGLLYRLLWRLVHEPGLRHDPIDPDRVRADHLAKAVRRDMHKMTAFVRFRTVADPDLPPAPEALIHATDSHLHIAWFEPEHHIVEAIAPFFVRRFTQMRWSILTPQRSVRWDGRTLTFGPGARKQDAPPADAGEALWLTYYANIFNPARLKLAMMQKEMPRRYWHNLPEAQLISELSARATERSGTMIAQETTAPARRIPSSGPGRAPVAVQPTFDARSSTMPLVHLADLKAAADRCRACPIGQFATQSVVGVGPAGAQLMVVGEQPGDQEDLRGLPFVGPAGQLFDRALARLGWPRDRLYITNAVKHFKFEPRGKRRIHKTPAQQEVDACLHWLEDELRLVAPQAVLALGATAARAVLGRPVAVMKERGQWHTDAAGRPVLVTLHPSALLRADPVHAEADFAQWLADLRCASDIVLAGS